MSICIAICGATCTGKTVLAESLASILGAQATILRGDNYYFDKPCALPFKEWNVDTPEAFDFARLRSDVSRLRNGVPTLTPSFDFELNRCTGQTEIRPSRYLILDSLLALHDPSIRALVDESIYLDSPCDTILARRVLRDVVTRNRPVGDVIERYVRFIRGSMEAYVAPQKEHATVALHNDFETDIGSLVLQVREFIGL